MKKIIILMLITLLSHQVAAQPSPYDAKGRYPKETGFYLAPKFIYSNQEAKLNGDHTSSSMGGGLAAGYNFYGRNDMFPTRIEVEYLMRETGEYNIDGRNQKYGVDTLMINAAIGINTGTKLTPYLTAGIGTSYIDGEINDAGTITGKTNNDLTWSVGADLTFSLNNHILFGLEYKYIDFGTCDIDTTTLQGADLSAHEFVFAIRYKF